MSLPAALPRCSYCDEPVDVRHRRGYMRAVTGWEAIRSSGGINNLKMRTETGAVAHTGCVDEAMATQRDQTQRLF